MRLSVYGYMLSEEQIQAGRMAMLGIFTMQDVKRALIAAGVPETKSLSMTPQWKWPYPVASLAAGRLLQKERKAGKICPTPQDRTKWMWDPAQLKEDQ